MLGIMTASSRIVTLSYDLPRAAFGRFLPVPHALIRSAIEKLSLDFIYPPSDDIVPYFDRCQIKSIFLQFIHEVYHLLTSMYFCAKNHNSLTGNYVDSLAYYSCAKVDMNMSGV